MSPARVVDTQLGPTPTRPFMRYVSQVQCTEHEGWEVTWTAETPLGHLANLAELEDMATTHNTAHHDAAPAAVQHHYTPAGP